MAHLLNLFFSRGDLANSMPWSTFIQNIGNSMNDDYRYFNKILLQFIRKIPNINSSSEEMYKCSNILGLISHIDKNYSLYYKSASKEANLDKDHLIDHAYFATIFLRNLLQITTYDSQYYPLFFDNVHNGKELEVFTHYLIRAIKFVAIIEFNNKSSKLIDEIISIFNIISYSINKKCPIYMEYKNVFVSSKRRKLVYGFFFKLLKMVIINLRPEASYFSYLYSGANSLLHLVTFNIMKQNTQEPSLSLFSKHVLFLLLYMVYGFKDGAQFAYNCLPRVEYQEGGNIYLSSNLVNPDENDKPGIILNIITEISKDQSDNKLKIDIDFTDISAFIVKFINEELVGLLSFALLHNNESFRSSLSNSPHVDLFVLGIANNIYNWEKLTYYQSSTLLILLLYLTRDINFVNYLHARNISNLKWLKEESRCNDWNVANITLYVLFKGLKQNSFWEKDQFSQDNYLGNIINLSSGQIHLNSEISHLIVTIFEWFINQYMEVIKIPNESFVKTESIEKVLSTILQTINIALTENILSNIDLIHRLLLLKEPIEKMAILQNNPKYVEEIANIITVLNFYQHKFTQIQNANGSINPTDVKNHIKHFAKNSSFLLTTNKQYPIYDFEEDSSYTFFLSYLKIMFENESLYNIDSINVE